MTVSLKIRARDIAIGFFGWIIFHNLLLLMLISEPTVFMITTSLAIVVAPLALYMKKRAWVGNGIISAIIINAGLWLYEFSSTNLGTHISSWVLVAIVLPYPLGGVFWSQ